MQSVSRVPTNFEDTARHLTRSMTQGMVPENQHSLPRVAAAPPIQRNIQSPISTKRRLRLSRRAAEQAATPMSVDAPAHNTRARMKAQATVSAPPAANTSHSRRESCLQQPTKPPSKTRTGYTAAVGKQYNRKQLQELTRRANKLGNKVHQAMAVMDAETGKLLNYRALMCHPKYKKGWGISSANEFRQHPNGVDGRFKGTNTTKLIHRSKVSSDCMKYVTYGKNCVQCTSREG